MAAFNLASKMAAKLSFQSFLSSLEMSHALNAFYKEILGMILKVISSFKDH